jgi:uncharacterized membrane protein YvbJ
MGFFDKVKDVAGNAMAVVSDAAKDVSEKGKEMTEKAKINRAIKNEETKINNLYAIIGQKIFEENVSAPAGFEEQFNGINNAKAEIERLQKELNDMVAANSCPKCGAKINPGQPFCQSCGEKLNGAPAPTAAPVNADVVDTTATETTPTEESNS